MSVSDEDGILDVSGAEWFASLLRRVPNLAVDQDLCQEDWGVVFFVRRGRYKFWIGLSAWIADGTWLIHLHHGSFAWLQWLSTTGRSELGHLILDVHKVLINDPEVTEIAWYVESEMSKPWPAGFPTPA